jgi:2-keto-4-pentenoate hydratase/2-oxohepta-3-ene-1,7-dioic acid hydratase in catechol pathway
MKVNGETKQDAPTSLMIHSVEDLVEHLSAWYDLSPGDLVWTGTPAGVGPMYKGDFVEAYLTNQKGEIVSRLNANCVVNG